MPKVLLAEDDRTMVSLLKTLLGMEGYQVITLLDMKGALVDNIRREMPDILLLDFYLGDKSGLDIMCALRKEQDLRHIRVIMTSGMDVSMQCMAAGADDFLQKPYMPDDLLQILRRNPSPK